jgi:hypothetical protein
MKKNRSTTQGLSRRGVEELELAGEWYSEWLRWQEEDGGTVFIWMPTISLGWCYEPRLKGYHPRLKAGGNYCRIEPLGAPLLSWLVIPTVTKGGRLQQLFRAMSMKGL